VKIKVKKKKRKEILKEIKIELLKIEI